ncbi:MAG: hypothetical protein JWO90_1732 [Solirubrobacterales bacterium]|nr:hypothetical protein [Solirubrobacterales bacterium]
MEKQRGKQTVEELVRQNKGPGFVVGSLRTLAGLAVAVAIGAVIFFGASALEGDDEPELAPWNTSSAPSVGPAPLADQ